MGGEDKQAPQRVHVIHDMRSRPDPDFKGTTLQEQISKQYSPILKKQESLDDYSPSLL